LYGGIPEELMLYCRRYHRIVLSRYILEELLVYLKEVRAAYKWRNAIEKLLLRICLMVEPSELPAISRDPKDDPVIAAALSGHCCYIITSDKDLLELRRYQGVYVVTPKDFLDSR